MPEVSIVSCDDYQEARLDRAIRQSIGLVGGIEKFVMPGQRVLLKINLLSATAPEKAVTTHPLVVKVLAKLVREAGGKPLVADSPGPVPYTVSGLRRAYRATGLVDLEESGLLELNWDTSVSSISCPNGSIVKRFEVIRPVIEADVVIAVPKLKTHMLTTLTGATKILFGVIPGYAKAGYHSKFNNSEQFAGMLLDLVDAIKPSLYVMDGILALEGDGPGVHGEPRQLGIVMASQDAVAMDVAACRITGINPMDVPMLNLALDREWWGVNFDEIEFAGDSMENVTVKDFKMPGRDIIDTRGIDNLPFYQRIWAPIAKQALSLRPVPDKVKCSGCSTCIKVCPQGAIVLSGKTAVIDDRECIRCYCCHEMCPEAAVDLKYGVLGKAVKRMGLLGK